LRQILGQPSAAHLAVAEEVFHHGKGVFDFGPHLRFTALKLLVEFFAQPFGQRPDFPALGRYVPADAGVLRSDLGAFLHALIACVAIAHLFLAMQAFMRLGHVRRVRRGSAHAMDQTRFRIDSNVRFHPEMPLLAFARRAHLRIAFPPLILGRARRGDDRRIDDRAFPQEQFALDSHRLDFAKESFG
jgi:hypothetical protein